MKKTITILFIIIFVSSMVFAQSAILQKGDKIVGGQLAIDDAGGADLGFQGTFELGVMNNLLNNEGMPTSLGVGGTVGFSSSDHTYGSFTTLVLGGNGYFHIDILGMDNLDTYIMAMLGFYRMSWNFDSEFDFLEMDNSETDTNFDFYLGARYFFSPALAAVIEIGTGFGTIHVGVDLLL
jgi:hypothetical protein